ncbi:MAG: ABC transporter permease, partial [Candidatus Dormibacteria bacterium]
MERGLDLLETLTEKGGPPLWRRAVTRALPPVVALAVLLGAWQLAVSLHWKPQYVIPSPAGVWASLADQWGQGHVTEAVGSSLTRG